jgi:hypothetical protein
MPLLVAPCWLFLLACFLANQPISQSALRRYEPGIYLYDKDDRKSKSGRLYIAAPTHTRQERFFSIER